MSRRCSSQAAAATSAHSTSTASATRRRADTLNIVPLSDRGEMRMAASALTCTGARTTWRTGVPGKHAEPEPTDRSEAFLRGAGPAGGRLHGFSDRAAALGDALRTVRVFAD